jgi:hypothetical protein
MWTWIVDKLVERAKRTPYFHLTGYMNRYWLVPYGDVVDRTVEHAEKGTHTTYNSTDGTGPVTWRRPVARLLQLCGVAARIHEILRSDLGRDPHNHPWSYVTVVLRGGYTEERFNEWGGLVSRKWHGPGSIMFRPANSWHKLTVPDGTVATTLFITGPKQQRWGFNVDGKVVPYTEYRREQ